jgi:hypothetical protein
LWNDHAVSSFGMPSTEFDAKLALLLIDDDDDLIHEQDTVYVNTESNIVLHPEKVPLSTYYP